MKRSLSSVSFEFCQDDFNPKSPTSQSITIGFQPRESDTQTNNLTNQETFNTSHGHSHPDSDNCCASHPQADSWEVKYRENQGFEYDDSRNLSFQTWEHYSPDFGLDSYAEYTQDISLSEISPAPLQGSSNLQSYHYDVHNDGKWSQQIQSSLFQTFDEPVQDAYVNIYETEHQSTPAKPSTPKSKEEEEYKDDDYDDDDEIFIIKSRKKKPKLANGNPRPKHVGKACTHCKKAHLACDTQRPCKRCSKLGKTDCVDVEHKRRGRPRSSPMHQKSNRPKTLSIPAFDAELLGFVPAAAE